MDDAGHLTLRGREALVARRAHGDPPHRRAAGDSPARDRLRWRACRSCACWRCRAAPRTATRAAATTSICSWWRARGARTRRTRCCSSPARSRGDAASSARTTSSTRTTCASPITTICSRRTRRCRWCRSRGWTRSTTSSRANDAWVRGFYPSYLPRPPGAVVAPSPAAAAGGGPAALVAGDEIERLLSAGWRFHLGRRAASAPRPDLVLDPGILKLHLSDHRRRVLEQFSDRLR